MLHRNVDVDSLRRRWCFLCNTFYWYYYRYHVVAAVVLADLGVVAIVLSVVVGNIEGIVVVSVLDDVVLDFHPSCYRHWLRCFHSPMLHETEIGRQGMRRKTSLI